MKLEYFHNFSDNGIKSYLVAYQRQGNDRNGNPIYIINVFDSDFYNINWKTNRKKDKYRNIKTTSYNIDNTIQSIIDSL